MAVAVDRTCSMGASLLRHGCEQPVVARCVYCGRGFCAVHGERRPDHQDVCSRRVCRRKGRDINSHLEWRRVAGEANDVSACAAEGCEERMEHRCVRCRLMFCLEDLGERRLTEALPGARGSGEDERGLVCEHCTARRRVWD